MAKLKAADIAAVKAQGFLINRGTELFSGRIVAPGTVFTAEDFKNMAELAATFGNGKLICTSRLAVEIPGIPFDKIQEEHGGNSTYRNYIIDEVYNLDGKTLEESARYEVR